MHEEIRNRAGQWIIHDPFLSAYGDTCLCKVCGRPMAKRKVLTTDLTPPTLVCRFCEKSKSNSGE